MNNPQKQQLTYLTFPGSDFKVDIRSFKTYEQKLFKGVS